MARESIQNHPVVGFLILVGVATGAIMGVVEFWERFFSDNSSDSDMSFNCVVAESTDSDDSIYYTQAIAYSLPPQEVTLLRWQSDYFEESGYTPEKRCKEVAPRFQEAYDNGSLTYITNGRMNNQPVICTSTEEGVCEDLLFTLRPEFDKPESILRQLRSGLRGKAIGTIPQSEGEDQIIIEVNLSETFGLPPK